MKNGQYKVPFPRTVLLLASIVGCTASAQAWAQETPTTTTEPSAPPTKAAPPDRGSPILGLVERLPPSAYPSSPVRGIYGGSLWMIFHGMQWPYYPKTGIGVSGYAWFDTGYEHIARGGPNEQGIKYMLQQGRVLLRVTPTWSNGNYFVQGQAELVADTDQSQAQPYSATADDVWLKFGKWKSWDIQVGRYEAWEVYHFGMGLDLYTLERNGATDQNYTPPPVYGVTYGFYRPTNGGQAALHVYPWDEFRVELQTQYGSQSGSNTVGERAVGILDLGWLKVKAGSEYQHQEDQADNGPGSTNSRGLGAGLEVVLDPYVEFGASAAEGLVDAYKSTDGSYDQTTSNSTYSLGGFLNARVVEDLVAGAGYDYTYLEDQHYQASLGRKGKYRHQQAFVAIQYLLWKQLFIKLVGGYAKAEYAPTFGPGLFANEMLSARLRLEYLF
jgi:hypothetical protein